MYYPNTLRAALWIVLAVMVLGSVVGIVLVGLALRFTSRKRQWKFSPNRAADDPHASCRIPNQVRGIVFLTNARRRRRGWYRRPRGPGI
jgi:hypothetical protein